MITFSSPSSTVGAMLRRFLVSHARYRDHWSRLGVDWPPAITAARAASEYLSDGIHLSGRSLLHLVLQVALDRYKEAAGLTDWARFHAFMHGLLDGPRVAPAFRLKSGGAVWDPDSGLPLLPWCSSRIEVEVEVQAARLQPHGLQRYTFAALAKEGIRPW